MGGDISVGIAACYGLDGPETESRWGREFLHSSRVALLPNLPPIQCTPGLSLGQSGRSMELTTHLHLAPMLKTEYSYTSTTSLGLRGLF